MLNATSSPPSRVLIPEARDHQRRRYLRTGLAAVLVAFALAGLIAFLVVLTAWGRRPGTGREKRRGSRPRRGAGVVLVRPVLCAAPRFSSSAAARTPSESCAAPYVDTPASLDVQPRPGGFTWSERPPDPVLAADPTSTRGRPVRHGGPRHDGRRNDAARFAPGPLGPSVMTLSARSTVASAAPHEVRAGGLREVLVRLRTRTAVPFGGTRRGTSSSTVSWPSTTAAASCRLRSFSRRPLRSPSFDGRLTIGGGLPHGEAVALAAALTASSRHALTPATGLRAR